MINKISNKDKYYFDANYSVIIYSAYTHKIVDKFASYLEINSSVYYIKFNYSANVMCFILKT